MATEINIQWVHDEVSGCDQPIVTYMVSGHTDVMRWCYHMLHGQVEFGKDARTILQRLRRRWGAKLFDAIDRPLTGNRMKMHSVRPRGGV